MESHIHSRILTCNLLRRIFVLSVQICANLWEKTWLERTAGLSGRRSVLSGHGFIEALPVRDALLTPRRRTASPTHQHDGDTSIEAEKRYKEPDFFKGQAELRALWSDPTSRKKLQEALAEKEFGRDQLDEMQRTIDAENSDLFDVLAHVAYALPPESREERATRARRNLNGHFNTNQRLFLDFVLSHYVSDGVDELDQEKLTPLLRLRYHNSLSDAVADLGKPDEIGRAFAGFQKYLYQARKIM